MRVGSGNNTYNWVGDWAKVPESESATKGWAHPGIIVTESGDVITCHSGDPTVLTFDKDGNLKSSWTGEFVDAHGITLVKDGGTEYLWIADNGSKRGFQHGYDYPPGAELASGQVFQTTLDGQTVMHLDQPPVLYQRMPAFRTRLPGIRPYCYPEIRIFEYPELYST